MLSLKELLLDEANFMYREAVFWFVLRSMGREAQFRRNLTVLLRTITRRDYWGSRDKGQ